MPAAEKALKRVSQTSQSNVPSESALKQAGDPDTHNGSCALPKLYIAIAN